MRKTQRRKAATVNGELASSAILIRMAPSRKTRYAAIAKRRSLTLSAWIIDQCDRGAMP